MEELKLTKIEDYNKGEERPISTLFTQNIEIKKENNDTSSLISELHKQAIATVVSNDSETKKHLLDKAKKSVKNEFEALEQESLNRKQQNTYNANEEACKNYGISKSVPLWQIQMMKIGSSFWFVIYFIIASFTIAPISVFFKGIKSFIKQTWLAIVFAILMYLIIGVAIPLLIKFLK